METVIKIDNRSKAAKSFLEYVKTLSFVKVEKPTSSIFNKETEKAIKEARAGIGIIKTSSHEDLMKKLRS
ncbi:MAG: hypothetical protein LBE82_12160 [Chitinophagaceae bacterium]|jgi:hypothetical protein|nr:hypothetical protein [Chitinophagaceae bacterium]